ncbi:MAG: YbhB/YbcL family Raf kinase inhibitor-like protein [Acidimicrobiales bacterium]
MSNDPLYGLPEVPDFTVTSQDFAEGENFQLPQMSGLFGVEGGEDRSPQLSWSGAPENTLSYAVTVFDPDAPTQSGFWHWSVANIPADVTALAAGVGNAEGAGLPPGAIQYRHDGGAVGFVGAAPPPGHGVHRYFFIVHALDVADIGVPAEATPAFLNFNIAGHILARAVLVANAKR